MSDPTNTSQRLESLKARWESDKGSRVFLQLADEYRRLGRLDDAAKVLEEGLKVSPGHLGARVARGRCLVELGRAAEAVGDLEKVIQADPTQMVAYRLLVQAYIQTGDGRTAAERLRVYSLLNDADPEIEGLSAKIKALGSGGHPTGAVPQPPAPPEPEAEAGGPGPAFQPAPEAAPEPEPPPRPEPAPLPRPTEPLRQAETVEQAFDAILPSKLPSFQSPPSGDEASASPERTAPHELSGLEPPEAPRESADEDPFGELTAQEPSAGLEQSPATAPAGGAALDPFPALGLPEDERRYLASVEPDLLGGGAAIQPWPAPLPDVTDATPAEVGSPAVVEPFEMEPPVLEVGEPATGEPAVIGSDEEAGPFELAPPAETAPAPFKDLAVREVEAAAPPVESAIPAAASSDLGQPSRPPEEDRAPSKGGRATVTLGRLYLRQGHLEEAETIFREVLERNPSDPEARAGLEEVAVQARTGGLEGKDLLVGYDGSVHGEGLTARKRFALERYLELIRGSGGDVH